MEQKLVIIFSNEKLLILSTLEASLRQVKSFGVSLVTTKDFCFPIG